MSTIYIRVCSKRHVTRSDEHPFCPQCGRYAVGFDVPPRLYHAALAVVALGGSAALLIWLNRQTAPEEDTED